MYPKMAPTQHTADDDSPSGLRVRDRACVSACVKQCVCVALTLPRPGSVKSNATNPKQTERFESLYYAYEIDFRISTTKRSKWHQNYRNCEQQAHAYTQNYCHSFFKFDLHTLLLARQSVSVAAQVALNSRAQTAGRGDVSKRSNITDVHSIHVNRYGFTPIARMKYRKCALEMFVAHGGGRLLYNI